MFNWLSKQRQTAETKRLHRELENARDDFSLALTEGTKLSNDIDTFLEKTSTPNDWHGGSVGKHDPLNPTEDADTVTSTGLLGGIGGGLALTAAGSAFLAFMALNRYLKNTNKNVNTITAMNELQRRRKAISEIAPEFEIGQSPKGKLYIDY